MGGPTAHPIGATLPSGDPSNSLTVRWGELGSRPRIAAAPVFVLEAVRERWRVRLLTEKELENWTGRAVGDEVSFLSAEEAAWWSSIHLSAGRAVERRIFIVLLVEVASGRRSGRRRLSGCDGRSGNSCQGVGRGCCGFMGGDLFVGLFEILFEDPDLVLHCVDQALHFSVSLLL